MYPDLSYLFHDLFGTPEDNWTSIFKTFGMMLVVAILTASWFFYKELKRKATEGLFQPTKIKTTVGLPASSWELISNGIFGFVLGFKGFYIARHFSDFQKDGADILLSLKGDWLMGILAAAFFAGISWWSKRKQVLDKPKEVIVDVFPHDRIGDLTIIAAVTGVLGAKIFAILEEPSGFWSDPIGTFFSGSGLAIYGGLICGALGVSWYLRKHKIPFWHTADSVAPALIIAYGVGRIGCQLAGDGDWGIVAGPQPDWWFLPDWMWAYDYPSNVNNANTADGYQAGIAGLIPECRIGCEIKATAAFPLEEACERCCGVRYCHALINPVYPTPFYELIASFLIGGILWALRKRVAIPGMIFFIYLILNGFERFWIEKIRVNVEYDWLPFKPTQAEIIAVLLFVAGIIGVIWLRSRAKRAA